MEISIREKIQRLLRTLLVRERMLVLNASDERVIREVKAKVKPLAQFTASGKPNWTPPP